MPTRGKGRTLVTTADRVLGVLALFGDDRYQWTVEDAAEALQIPLSTAYRYFKSLAQSELLSQHSTGHYTLGPAICALDRAMRLHDPFVNAAKAEMQHLASRHPGTIVLLTRLYKNTVMCVHREGEELAAQGYERGRPMPLHRGAASKAILASLSSGQARKLFADNGMSAAIHSDLQEELKRIGARGYSITRGEIDPAAVGISVPVFRGARTLEGSLSFVLDSSQDNDELAMTEALIRSRKVIEANLLIAELNAARPDI